MLPDRTNLLNQNGDIDRAAIMRDAHRQWRVMSRHGWSWSESLTYSAQRGREQKRLSEFIRLERAMRALADQR
jgi:hypothetical protein